MYLSGVIEIWKMHNASFYKFTFFLKREHWVHVRMNIIFLISWVFEWLSNNWGWYSNGAIRYLGSWLGSLWQNSPNRDALVLCQHDKHRPLFNHMCIKSHMFHPFNPKTVTTRLGTSLYFIKPEDWNFVLIPTLTRVHKMSDRLWSMHMSIFARRSTFFYCIRTMLNGNETNRDSLQRWFGYNSHDLATSQLDWCHGRSLICDCDMSKSYPLVFVGYIFQIILAPWFDRKCYVWNCGFIDMRGNWH